MMATSMSGSFGRGGFSFFPLFGVLFGVLFIIFGVGMCIHSFVKADKYAEAQERYRQRRSQLLDRNRKN